MTRVLKKNVSQPIVTVTDMLHVVGRHILILPHASPLAARIHDSAHPRSVLVGIGRMFTLFPYWDISWLIGISFTIGCLIFVMCGLFYWLPIAYPSTEFAGESAIAGGVTAFIGATLFQIGAVLLFFESYNDRAETQFGGAMEHLFVDRLKVARRSRTHRPKHFEAEKPKQLLKHFQAENPKQPTPENGDPKQLSPSSSQEDSNVPSDTFTERTWQWLPSWHDFTTHYIYEIGFLASMTMSIGATIFYVAGIMALPGIFDKLDDAGLYGGYYFTYLFGGVLFAVSSLFYILETQPNWYTPQPLSLGWHIGFWNMVGSIGWTLAASFGYCKQEWCEYQSELALVWASAAFALGSAFQWYESLDKYVVIIED